MEPFSWLKFFDFSMPTIGKVISIGLKFIIIVGVVALIAWSVYVTVIKPHTKPTPTSEQRATTIINNTYNCKSLVGWGCGKK